MFAAVWAGAIDPADWAMDWERPLRPALIGSAFFHVSWLHLLSNLIYLWVLGRIVEGTIGTRSFLLLGLAIVLGAHGLEAALLYGREGGSYGASGLVCGLLAAAFLLAPRSEVHCFLLLLVRLFLFTLPLVGFAVLVLGLELALTVLTGFEPSSALLHVTGAAIGALLAYAGVKLRWLDTRGWDWLSLRRRKEQDPAHAWAKSLKTRRAKPVRCSTCGRKRSPLAKRCVYCGAR